MRILLSGYYGFANLGDEALLQGLLSQLSDYQVTVLSQRPACSRALHTVPARHRYLELIPALLATDVLISGGGSLLQDKTSRRSLQYYLAVIQLAKRLGKKVVVYGQSIGPLSAWGRERLCTVLNDVPIAVRDRNSQELLQSWQLEPSLTADSALLLPTPTSPVRSEAIILIPRAGYPQLSQSFIAFARAHPEHNYQLMPFHPAADQSEIARLQAALPQAHLIEAHSPHVALEQLARAKHIYSGRLHGVILAALLQRPCTGFAYDPKVQAFCQESGMRCYGLEPSPEVLQQELGSRVDKDAIATLTQRAAAGVAWLKERIA